jgi:hypothetical protein
VSFVTICTQTRPKIWGLGSIRDFSPSLRAVAGLGKALR